MYSLPTEIKTHIYGYDPTYLQHLQHRVVPELDSVLFHRRLVYDRQCTILNYWESWANPPACVLEGELFIRGVHYL